MVNKLSDILYAFFFIIFKLTIPIPMDLEGMPKFSYSKFWTFPFVDFRSANNLNCRVRMVNANCTLSEIDVCTTTCHWVDVGLFVYMSFSLFTNIKCWSCL